MSDSVSVFFYGLFMDESLLASKGIRPGKSVVSHVDGYTLRIGERATLLPEAGSRAYGVLMTIDQAEAQALYAEPGVSDYIAEPVVVNLPGNTRETAICYNLPADKLAGINPEYATALHSLASRLGLPDDYLEHIRRQL